MQLSEAVRIPLPPQSGVQNAKIKFAAHACDMIGEIHWLLTAIRAVGAGLAVSQDRKAQSNTKDACSAYHISQYLPLMVKEDSQYLPSLQLSTWNDTLVEPLMHIAKKHDFSLMPPKIHREYKTIQKRQLA